MSCRTKKLLNGRGLSFTHLSDYMSNQASGSTTHWLFQPMDTRGTHAKERYTPAIEAKLNDAYNAGLLNVLSRMNLSRADMTDADTWPYDNYKHLPVEFELDQFVLRRTRVRVSMVWRKDKPVTKPDLYQEAYDSNNNLTTPWEVFRYADLGPEWECATCTCLNSAALMQCTVCQADRVISTQADTSNAQPVDLPPSKRPKTVPVQDEVDGALQYQPLTVNSYVSAISNIPNCFKTRTWLYFLWLSNERTLEDWKQDSCTAQILANTLECVYAQIFPEDKVLENRKALLDVQHKIKNRVDCCLCRSDWDMDHSDVSMRTIPYHLDVLEGGTEPRSKHWNTKHPEDWAKLICKDCMLNTMLKSKIEGGASECLPWPMSPQKNEDGIPTYLLPRTLMLLFHEDKLKELLLLTKWLVLGVFLSHPLGQNCPKCNHVFFVNPKTLHEVRNLQGSAEEFGKCKKVTCPRCSEEFENRWAIALTDVSKAIPVPNLPGTTMQACSNCRTWIQEPGKASCNLRVCERCGGHVLYGTSEFDLLSHVELYKNARKNNTLWTDANLQASLQLRQDKAAFAAHQEQTSVFKYNPNHQAGSSIPEHRDVVKTW